MKKVMDYDGTILTSEGNSFFDFLRMIGALIAFAVGCFLKGLDVNFGKRREEEDEG